MASLLRPLLAGLLGLATALGVVACGNRDALIPPTSARSMVAQLDRLSTALDNGNCITAARALRILSDRVGGLPNSVDAALRARLRDGVANLEERVPRQCA